MKFLIDEDLSPKVAERLRVEGGVDAIHVRDRGLLGRPDLVILQKAYEEDRILVTANVKDFQRLACSRELHPGVILVLDGALSRDEQLALLHKAIAELEQELLEGRDLVNRVLEIEANGRCNFYDLSLHSKNDEQSIRLSL
ncbi:MAG: DUF5615 family PIN-like protein [Caldilineaceae bacterium]